MAALKAIAACILVFAVSAEARAQVPQSPGAGRSDGGPAGASPAAVPKLAAPTPPASSRPGVGKLPATATEAERLIATFSALNPSLGLLDRYVGAVLAERRTNEIEWKERAESEARRLRQSAIADEFWVAGTITVGAYDKSSRSFPVTGWDLPVRDRFMKLRFEPADTSPLLSIALQPSEAELALAETPSDRRLQILIRAVPADVKAGPDQFAPIAVFGDVKGAVVWTPRKNDVREPFIIAQISPAAPATKAEPAGPGSLLNVVTLDPETIDLLLLKHAPQLVTDAMLKHMLVNRWATERKTPDTRLPPNDYPRFFKAGRPAPNEVEAGKLLSSFRSWAEAQSARLPARFRVLVSEQVGTHLQCGLFLGAGLRGGWPPAMPAELDGVLTGRQFERLVDSLGKQSAAAFEAARQNEPYGVGPLYFALGKWIKRPSADEHCGSRLFETASKAARINSHAAGLPIAILEIPKWISNNPIPLGISDLLVTGDASSVKVVQDGRQPPRLLVNLQPETFSFARSPADGSPESGEVVQVASFANVRDFAIDVRKETDGSPSGAGVTVQAAPVAKQTSGAELDVVGIRLGMSVAQAREEAEKNNQFETALSFSPKNKSTATAFSSGTVLVSTARDEYIILIHDPLQGEAKVVAIGRFSYEGPGAINEKELLQSLTEKYTVARHSHSSGVIYQSSKAAGPGDRSRCFVAVGGVGGALEFRDQAGAPATGALMPQALSATMRDVSHIPWIGFQTHYLNRLEALSGCGANATAWVPDNAGQLAGFVVWITDVGAYAESLSKLLRGNSSTTSKRPRL